MLSSIRNLLVSAALLLSCAVANAQATFDDCGFIINGVTCEVFLADSGQTYLLSSPVPVSVGDRLHVVGIIDTNCISFCQQGPCLNATLVEDCAPGTSICEGDGGDQMGCTNCPCGNEAPIGSAGGCLNSGGRSAELIGTGIASPQNDQLGFEVHGANENTFGILVSASQLLPANPASPCAPGSGVNAVVFDGLRCVGQNLLRHGTRATDSNGDIGVTNNGWGGSSPPAIGLIAQGGFVVGQTRHWQVFYRELGTAVCQTGQNTTNAVSVTFVAMPPGGPVGA